MVAGKVKSVMGLHRSSPTAAAAASPSPRQSKAASPKLPPSSPANSSEKGPIKAAFSRSFGAYFPRSSAQVQPRPPDVAELLRLLEQMRERESRLQTEILEQKLLNESAALVPVLETVICNKNSRIDLLSKRIDALEAENKKLRAQLGVDVIEERQQNEEKLKAMAAEIKEFKKREEAAAAAAAGGVSTTSTSKQAGDSGDERSLSSQRPIDLPAKPNAAKSNMRNGLRCTDAATASSNHENPKAESGGGVDPPKAATAETERRTLSRCSSEEAAAAAASELSLVRSRCPRVPNPPPRPSSASFSAPPSSASKSVPAPPPPPPPLSSKAAAPPPPPPLPRTMGPKPPPAKVQRVPELVQFYHSLMRRECSRRDSSGGLSDSPATSRDMIGEIENRSAYLLAIKSDVETQGDFIRLLIKEVESAAFTQIEDVVPFVKWLDEELSYLVDERAVLKHFDWPEQKADALREAAFGYCDLKKLESEATSFLDDARQPCGPALKKMQALFEKLGDGAHNLIRMRESATNRYRGFRIPTDWMLENGYLSQIKLASVKLAMKYMKRVSSELESGSDGTDKEELIVQGVRFAFRVHQFAGGFDVDTMRAFRELRDRARSCQLKYQNR